MPLWIHAFMGQSNTTPNLQRAGRMNGSWEHGRFFFYHLRRLHTFLVNHMQPTGIYSLTKYGSNSHFIDTMIQPWGPQPNNSVQTKSETELTLHKHNNVNTGEADGGEKTVKLRLIRLVMKLQAILVKNKCKKPRTDLPCFSSGVLISHCWRLPIIKC